MALLRIINLILILCHPLFFDRRLSNHFLLLSLMNVWRVVMRFSLLLSDVPRNVHPEQNTKNQTAVKLTVVPCAPVVEVKIKRPDTKYQLGFSVQNGVVSLLSSCL